MVGEAKQATLGAAAPAKNRRLEFLDALRGLAAAYVLMYHMVFVAQPNLALPRWVEKVAHAGGSGVTLFFIVSAFSLYYTMPLRANDRSPVIGFFIHRFFRIAPLFYAMIALSALRDIWLFDAHHSVWMYVSQLAFVFNFVPGHQEGFVWAGWTIGVEMVFYAVFPLIYARVRSTGDSVAFAFLCLLLWMFVQLLLEYSLMPPEWEKSILQWSSLRYFPVFAVGAIVYHQYLRPTAGDGRPDDRRGVGNALIMIGLFWFYTLLNGWMPNVFGDLFYWQGVAYGSILLGTAMSPWKVIVNRITTFLGKVSYSVYLLHTTVIYLLSPVYARIYGESPSLSISFLSCLFLTFAIVVPLSWISYRFIEVPGISLGRRVSRAINRDAVRQN